MRVVPGYGAATTASRGADAHHVTTGAAATTVVQPGAAATTVVQPGATATASREPHHEVYDATATCVTTRVSTHDTSTTGATTTRTHHHEVHNAPSDARHGERASRDARHVQPVQHPHDRITRCKTRITDARHVQPVQQHTTASRGAQRASRDGATITR